MRVGAEKATRVGCTLLMAPTRLPAGWVPGPKPKRLKRPTCPAPLSLDARMSYLPIILQQVLTFCCTSDLNSCRQTVRRRASRAVLAGVRREMGRELRF